MAAKPQVVLEFAGDASKLESAMDQVGTSAEDMGRKVGSASDDFDRAGRGTQGLIDKADTADTRMMGFRDTITGVTDTFRGLTDESKSTEERLLLLGMGLGDFASGMANLVIPALGGAATRLGGLASSAASTAGSVVTSGARMIGSAVATTASFVAQIAIQIGRWVMLGVQAMLAAGRIALAWMISLGPIALVAAAVVGLAVLIIANWDRIKRGIGAAVDWVAGKFRQFVAFSASLPGRIGSFFSSLGGRIRSFMGSAVSFVRQRFNALVSFFSGLPGRVAGVFRRVGSAVRSAFREAIASVKRIWNSTVGGFGFTMPGFLGGGSIRIPRLHAGGIVPGAPGQEVLARLQSGERVIPRGAAGSSGAAVIEIRSGGSAIDDALVDLLRGAIQRQGGNVQTVLGN